MKILEIETKNILGIPDGRRRFSESVTLVTGGPASGKTSLLRAIVAAKESTGAYGAPPAAAGVLKRGTTEGSLAARWAFSEAEQRVAKIAASPAATLWSITPDGAHVEAEAAVQFHLARYSNEASTPKMEMVPAPRGLPRGLQAVLPAPVSDGTEALRRPSEAPEKYAGILAALHEAALAAASSITRTLDERGVALRAALPDPLDPFKANVAKMCPDLRLVAVEPRAPARPAVWFQTRKGLRVELADLSQGELQGVLFACLFVMAGLHRSIVLLDTPELHIHPEEQARFFHSICELGTDNQIIAATTSPAILASVAAGQIIDLSTNDGRTG